MGDVAISEESALFSPSRSRPVERSKNGSWRTNADARNVASVALVIYPLEFTAHPEDFRTSGLPNFQTHRRFGRGFCDLYPVGFSSLRRDGDRARQRSRATMLFCNSRLRFCSAGVDPIEWGKQASERTLRGGGISAASALRPPPRTYPCKEAKSDVREKRRSRTN